MGGVTNKVGQKIGRLTVIELSTNRTITGRSIWICHCECGNTVEVAGASLTSARVNSCGCLNTENCIKLGLQNKTHGASHTAEYNTRNRMLGRCTNPNDPAYCNYGGRGISVCDRWLNSFENFLEDMGYRPTADHSIDRIDNNGNYEPGNCRWATRIEQNNNRRDNVFYNYKGIDYSLAQLADLSGINTGTIRHRIETGMSVENAVETPARNRTVMT